MILYNYYRSSSSYRVRLILAYKNISYQYIPINLLKREQDQPSFRQLSPLGQVPCLVTSDVYLTQSMAIALFLEEKYPNPPLLPQNPTLRAKVIEFCEFINCAQPLQNLSTLEFLTKKLNVDEHGKKLWLHHWLRSTLEALEALIKQNGSKKFSVGNTITLADCFLMPHLFSARRFDVDFSDLMLLQSIEASLSNETWVVQAHPSNQPDYPTSHSGSS
ncbi:MAG: maleylacetoacetate isomerase [Bdellovibrionaceae bacterium]|nr:maleylacetoacetate isomerase [Pseudobdellovibrionaceae bacterium]MDW8191020.1 maleylacetoacetate isomerase [Pseudobdellovibrionaceae bacterium]